MIIKALRSSKKLLLDLLFPRFCLRCGEEGSYLCDHCMESLIFLPPICFVCKKLSLKKGDSGQTCALCRPKTKVVRFLSPFLFKDPFASEFVHALKYQRIRLLAEPAGRLLAEYCTREGVRFDADVLFVPVPLHRVRLRSRGFNQSDHIARWFLRYAMQMHLSGGFEIRNDVLIRAKNTLSQTGLGLEARIRNMEEAFFCPHPSTVVRKHIVLIDDVTTTGATLESAATTLKHAGARRVDVLTLAR